MYICKLFSTDTASLKLHRTMDEKELSISFDNSWDAFGNLKTISMFIFADKDSQETLKEIYPCSDQEIVTIMQDFLNGKEY